MPILWLAGGGVRLGLLWFRVLCHPAIYEPLAGMKWELTLLWLGGLGGSCWLCRNLKRERVCARTHTPPLNAAGVGL
ncbi:MAG: hypothetical protein KGS61_10890 [Verrucomicrobia bacterium]|nr:hypothetical protein [Verrucomicrobiota bacterium]